MARGNHVDGVKIQKRFGLYIVTPVFNHQSFEYYSDVAVSKKGTLIGYWNVYRDYLTNCLPENLVVIRVRRQVIFLKQKQKDGGKYKNYRGIYS